MKQGIFSRGALRLQVALAFSLISFGASEAAPLNKVGMSYSQKSITFLPMSAAVDAGYFRAHGIDASIRYLPAEEGIPALISGQEQLIGIGGADAVSAVAAGAELKLIMSFTPINTFQFWARPKYASANALKGQPVGITSKTGSLYASTLLALNELGLKPLDVVITPLGGIVNVNSSLISGTIAAAASVPPSTYQFKRAGFVDLVDLAKKRIPSVTGGLWASKSYIKAHRAIVQSVVDALAETIRRFRTDRDFGEREITRLLGIKDKGELDFTYDFYAGEVFSLGAMPEVAQIKSDKDSLIASNPKAKNVDIAAMVDQSFVRDVGKSGQ